MNSLLKPVSIILGLGIIVIALSVFGVSPAAAGITPADQGTPPPGVSRDWWSRERETLQQEEYFIARRDRSGFAGHEAGYQSPNRMQGFRTFFTEDGIRLTPLKEDGFSWTWGLSLVMPAETARFATPRVQVTDNRIDLDRGWITEWYVNEAKGLEQGFTIHYPPESNDAASLTIDLRLGGTMQPTFAEDGQAVVFHPLMGAFSILKYGQLKVTDDAGRELRSRFEGWSGGPGYDLTADGGGWSGGIRIVVETSGAVYPLTVDPLITGPILESNQASSDMGVSVATAGDINGDGYADVIVGADRYDNGEIDEGAAFVYYGSSSGLNLTPVRLESNQANARFGVSVATAGDVNGDGYADVIVGARNYDNGQTDEGAAFLYYGSATGLNPTPLLLESNQMNAYFGISVAMAGDVNGDGYSDVIVGASDYDHGETNEGAAFLYYGSASGLNTTPLLLESNQTIAFFGSSVATAGDVNGDGYSDVIVGAPPYNHGETDEGVAFLYYGSATGLNPTPLMLESNQAGAYYGGSVATAGDVNDDGYADIIVGAPYYTNGESGEGAAFLYYGSATGLNLSPLRLETDQSTALFGCSVATAGDVNGDGYADIIVGAYHYNSEGSAFLYFGSVSGLNLSPLRLVPNQVNAYFGWSVAAAGDVDGDGYGDVIAGAPNNDYGEGAAYVFCGVASGLITTPSPLEVNQASANFGTSVATAGDVNGDGYADIIVGAPNYDNGETNEGAAFLYYGTSSGLNPTPLQLESNQASAYFGRSVASAGDVNGDGYADVIVGAPYYDNGETNEGAALLYYGSAVGLNDPPLRLESDQAFAYFGNSVTSAGDVNGDGYADILVGAPYYTNGESEEGAVFLYYGAAAGLVVMPLRLESNQMGAHFGQGLASAGDVNGDGYSDIIVGAYLYDNGEIDEGAAFLYYGAAAGLNTTPLQLESHQLNAYYGGSVATAGDVNGDGYADVIVGALEYDNGQTDEGAAFLYYGAAAGLNTTPLRLESNQANAFFGGIVSPAGDVNGDGYGDIIVGARNYDNGETDEGVAFVYYGSAAGLNPTPQILEANQASASFGNWVAAAGDVNGDGFADVLVGAFLYDDGETDEGAVFLSYGGGGIGAPIRPRQLRADLTAPIAPLGLARQGQFRLGLRMHSPLGRGMVKLEWQAVPLGQTFNPLWNPIQSGTMWLDSQAGGLDRLEAIDLGSEVGPFKWRARVHYHFLTCPFQRHSRWFTLADNGLQETDLRGMPDIPCVIPDEPCWIYAVVKNGSDYTLNFQGPNQDNQRTGWNIRRSNNSAALKSNWPVVGSNVVDMDAATANYQWTDHSGADPGSGGIWYYQVTTFNNFCPAEGPF